VIRASAAASLGAVLPAGIGRDSRLLSADGTAFARLRRVIRPRRSCEQAIKAILRQPRPAVSPRREEARGSRLPIADFCAAIGLRTNSCKSPTLPNVPSGEIPQGTMDEWPGCPLLMAPKERLLESGCG
jgi:hypothetical protein